jgi:uncharacterized membrane protein YoaK (UPF0700 family)
VAQAGGARPPTGTVERSQTIEAMLLSFVAAFVDSCGFIGLFGLFSAHVTGNFVLIGAELVHPGGFGLVGKLLALPVFIASVVLTVRLAHALPSAKRPRVTVLLWLEAMLLALAAAVPLWLGRPARADDVAGLTTGMILVAAMGLQNALMRIELPRMPPTTVMTGSVTQVTIDAVLLLDRTRADPQVSLRLHRMWPTVVAFAIGAACGAACYAIADYWCLLMPAALCAWLGQRLGSA